MKTNPCANCSSIYHSKWQCPGLPKKALRKEAVKTKQKRLDTTAAWFAANPPTVDGLYWVCYISKHPDCPYYLTRETVVLEHDLSKARRKDLQFDITNIYPSCAADNKAKGSLSARQYLDLDN